MHLLPHASDPLKDQNKEMVSQQLVYGNSGIEIYP